MCLLVPVTIYHLQISGCCIYTAFFCKHLTRAIFVEETSLAQILCTCKHEKRITLIMNKMLVAFAFRPLAVLYMLSCINNNELKRTKLNHRITLVYSRQNLRHLYTSYMYMRSYELQKILIDVSFASELQYMLRVCICIHHTSSFLFK